MDKDILVHPCIRKDGATEKKKGSQYALTQRYVHDTLLSEKKLFAEIFSKIILNNARKELHKHRKKCGINIKLITCYPCFLR